MPLAFRELRHAARALARQPAFAIAVVVAIALGVAATTTLFAVVAGVLLRPLPYHAPDRLVTVLHGPSVNGPLSPADYVDLRREAKSFRAMGAGQAWGANLLVDGRSERLAAMQVSGSLFGVLGVPAAHGRVLTEADEAASARVAVISDALWMRRFGGSPAAIGRAVILNGEAHTIVGVMPPGFRFAPFWQTKAELWVPLTLAGRLTDRSARSLRVFARLRDHVTLDSARAEVAVINQRLTRDWPDTNTGLTTGVAMLTDKAVGPVRPMLLAVFGMAAGLLLIGCVNVATLVLARVASRQNETAIRLALGASRGRLLASYVSEAMLVGLAGAAAGIALAAAGTAALRLVLPLDSLPPHAVIELSPLVLLFAVSAALVTALLASVLPAWRQSGAAPGDVTRESTRALIGARGGSRTRATLVAAEVALTFVLATAAALLGRTLINLQQVDPGFNPDGLVAMSVTLDVEPGRGDARAAFFTQLASRLAATPRLTSVSAINHLPLAGDLWRLTYAIEGRPPAAPGQRDRAAFRIVLPGYFRTMEQGLMAGRDFSSSDTDRSVPVAVINATMARRQWPGTSAVGARLRFETPDEGPKDVTVVGVVTDARQQDLTEALIDEIYLPLAQRPTPAATQASMTVVARMADTAVPVFAAVRDQVRQMDRRAAAYDAITLDDVVASELWRERLTAHLVSTFAVIALVLAAIGVEGVVRYAVSRRTREFGVRMALGATARQVAVLAVGEAASPVIAGTLAGLCLALATGRLIGGLLHGVVPYDLLTLGLVMVSLVMVGAVAAWRPAARAAAVDPNVALRDL